MYSYGSGAVAEFYSLKLVKGYKEYLNIDLFKEKLDLRKKVSIEEYETMFFEESTDVENNSEGLEFYLKNILDHKRIYELRKEQ